MSDPTLRLRDGSVAWQEVDGETILLDLTSSTYLGANSTGSALWSLLADGATRGELVDHLVTTFEVERRQAEYDVDQFIAACRNRGFLG